MEAFSSSPFFFQNHTENDSDTTLTQEEFFAFHNIDRQFFARLVITMRCEPAEAMHVAAFWMWLERLKKAQYVAIIVTCPDDFFKAIFDETILCLKVAESNSLVRNGDLPMVQCIIGEDKDDMTNLRFFYENRLSIIHGVGHIVEEICLKAFHDLIKIAYDNRSIPTNHHKPLPNQLAFNAIHGSPNLGVNGSGRIGDLTPVSQPPLPRIHEESFGDGMNVLANYPTLKVGDSSVPLRIDHFIESNYNSFQRGGSRPFNNIPRFPGGGSSSSNIVPRFSGGGSSPPNNVPRFLGGGSSPPNNVPRFLGSDSSPSNNVPRFLGGGFGPLNNVPQFLGGGSSPSNNVPRFLRGGSSPPNIDPRHLGVGSSPSNYIPQFLRDGSSPSNNVPRFLEDGSSSSNYVPRFQGNGASSLNDVPQFQGDGSSYSNYVSLFQRDGNSSWDESNSSNYVPQFQKDGASSSSYVPLFQKDGASASNYVPKLPTNIVSNNTNYAFETQQEVLQRKLIIDQLFAQLQLSENSQAQGFEEKPNVLPSERTIFLTFSKGYPILEYELRKFLNRSFGDIIEALHMQEVGEKEQPLYARLVVRDTRAMETVLSDGGKSKFTINGKHVWARKYVRKNNHSTLSLPTNKAK